MFLTYEEYKNIVGTQINEDEFNGLINKAADIISSVCRFFYLTDDDLKNDKLQWRAQKFKNAIAYQVEFMHKNGYTSAADISNGTIEADSLSIGRTSISGGGSGASASSKTAALLGLGENAYITLRYTGLLYRGGVRIV